MRSGDSASNQSFSGSTTAGFFGAAGAIEGALGATDGDAGATVLTSELIAGLSAAGRGRGNGGDTMAPGRVGP